MTQEAFRVLRMSPRKNLDHLEHGLADALGSWVNGGLHW